MQELPELDSYETSVMRSNELEKAITANPQNYRILTGERPTGKLHIGHLFGSILERKRLQSLGVETFLIIADYQVITDRDELGDLKTNVYQIIIDNLAAGLDADKANFFVHSQVPELNQLVLPFLSLISEPELHRNPTVKAELLAAQVRGARPLTGLMLTYPVHQAADILFCKGNVVPVGKDQLPHIEVTRLLARRFNEHFCGVKYDQLDSQGKPLNIGNAVFPEPNALLSKASHVPGLDGRKMSKSFGNTISLSMSEDETASVIKKSPTDSIREVSYDPENRVEVSSLLTICALVEGLPINGEGERRIADEINSNPNYGAGLLKARLTDALNDYLRPHRQRRAELEQNMDYVQAILRSGIETARARATATLNEVHRAMGTMY
jgi:tryptophanyl-tRNA synthetase